MQKQPRCFLFLVWGETDRQFLFQNLKKQFQFDISWSCFRYCFILDGKVPKFVSFSNSFPILANCSPDAMSSSDNPSGGDQSCSTATRIEVVIIFIIYLLLYRDWSVCYFLLLLFNFF